MSINPPCEGCGGPHPFDLSVPSDLWNRVIRESGKPDYLCPTCILRAFVLAGVDFTATLWSREFGGLPIEVRVRSNAATVPHVPIPDTHRRAAERTRMYFRHVPLNEAEKMPDPDYDL